jgi:hypothetical protein
MTSSSKGKYLNKPHIYPTNNAYRMTPQLQVSTAWPEYFWAMMISGAA